MKNLIEALTIFLKYGNKTFPTCCEHDVLLVLCTKDVSQEDSERLEELGFRWSKEFDCWASFRYGSA